MENNQLKIKCKVFYKDHLDKPNKEYYISQNKIKKYENKYNIRLSEFIPKICLLKDINGGSVIIRGNDSIYRKFGAQDDINIIMNETISRLFEGILRDIIRFEDDFNNKHTLTKRIIEEIEYYDYKFSVIILDHYENKTCLVGKVF